MTAHTQIQFVQLCIQSSSLALIFYDYFLTLPREIAYVWNRPFHALTVMFFFCRYSLIANIVFLVGLVNKFNGLSCDTAYLIAASFGVLGRIGIIAIIGGRTCAIYQYNRVVVAIFAILGALVAALAIAHVPHVSCTGTRLTSSTRTAVDLLCVCTVIFELLSTIFVAFGCYRNVKSIEGSLFDIQKSSLLFLMLKEGLLYTCFVTAFTTTAMILNYTAPLGSFFQRLLNALTMPISGIMTARFLLHIREWHDKDLKGSLPTDIDNLPGQFQFRQPPTEGSLSTVATFQMFPDDEEIDIDRRCTATEGSSNQFSSQEVHNQRQASSSKCVV